MKFHFTLSEEWDGLMVFAQFQQNGASYNHYLDDNNEVFLPPEIVAGSYLLLLSGSHDGVVGLTAGLKLTVDESGLVSDPSSTEISQSLYEQLVTMVKDMKDKTSGEDGFSPIVELSKKENVTTLTVTDATGPHSSTILDGKDGEDGHTPERGVDYYTDADKAEIIQNVLESLPTAFGVGF